MGCWLYKQKLRLNRRRTKLPEPPRQGTYNLLFSHPFCSSCLETEERLKKEELPLEKVSIDKEPELARHYGVRVVPTIYRVREGQWQH
jgi:hypothetical protein